ncbi:MAG: TetR family transcriptional regulator C-terminal domain-containing protein [Salinimicrobium sp.]
MAAVKKEKKVMTREDLVSLYMDYVLANAQVPGTVFKFCKENKITEEEFYNHFGSFEALEREVWVGFFDHSLELMEKSEEYSAFSAREKLLTFYFTFFEVLKANRSYVLFSLNKSKAPLKNLEQLKRLRRKVKDFAASVDDDSEVRLLKSSTVFSEAVWLQLLFLLKFWKDDNSPQFESTDVAIEKSVNTLFDLFNTAPLERVLDLGKFLWKEKMS